MEALERLVAEAEIRRTVGDYCQSCDDGRFADYAACFTADGEVVLGPDVVAAGRPAIEAWITKAMPPAQRGMHVTVNTLITWTGDASAHATTDFLFLAHGDSGPRITSAGRYLDTFAPDVDGRWLFARREIRLLRLPG